MIVAIHIGIPAIPCLSENFFFDLWIIEPFKSEVSFKPAHASLVSTFAHDTDGIALVIHITARWPSRIKPIQSTFAIANSKLTPVVELSHTCTEVMPSGFIKGLHSFPLNYMTFCSSYEQHIVCCDI